MIVSREWLEIATDGGRIGGSAAEDRAARRRRRRERLGARGSDYDPLGGAGLGGQGRRSRGRRPVPESGAAERPSGD